MTTVDLQTEEVLGYSVVAVSFDRCVDSIVYGINSPGECKWLACINPHSYVEANRNPTFASALHSADWLVPDGIGIIVASKVLGGSIRKRITGSDIFFEVHRRLDMSGRYKVFLLGATANTLDLVKQRLANEFPRVEVVGTYSPPFRTHFSNDDNTEMLKAINASCADVLWVGMSAPKQELWLAMNRSLLNVRFAAGVGAVFDFYSGKVPRSSPIYLSLGLEWLPRLIQEPKRLWRRMAVSAPIFLAHLLFLWLRKLIK